jgi:hypothetical protein
MADTDKFFLYEINFYGKQEYRVCEQHNDTTHVMIARFYTLPEAEKLLSEILRYNDAGINWRVTDIGRDCLGVIVPNTSIPNLKDNDAKT